MLGWPLVIFSFVLWFIIPGVYWLPISGQYKAITAGGLYMFSQLTFWCGALFIGPEGLRRVGKKIRTKLWRS